MVNYQYMNASAPPRFYTETRRLLLKSPPSFPPTSRIHHYYCSIPFTTASSCLIASISRASTRLSTSSSARPLFCWRRIVRYVDQAQPTMTAKASTQNKQLEMSLKASDQRCQLVCEAMSSRYQSVHASSSPLMGGRGARRLARGRW